MKDLPIRKQIRLKNYSYNENGAYFITICVKNKEEILSRVVGVDAHIDPSQSSHIQLLEYGQIIDQYIKNIPGVDKYIIMPNHIHMIISIKNNNGSMWASTPTQTISQMVKSLKALVTKQIGFSIWQRSFHDHIIRNKEEYEKIWRYIDENPKNWAKDIYFIKT